MRRTFFAGKLLAWCIILSTVFKLASLLFTPLPQIDELLFAQKIFADVSNNLPSSMAVNTAVGFFLSGIALLLLNYETQKGRMPAHFIAVFIFMVGYFSLLGYLYGAPEFYDLLRYLPMAINTAICFILVSLAFLFIYPGKGLAKEISQPLMGAILGRFLLPFAISMPLLLGWIRVHTHRNHLFSTELGITLLVSSIVMVFCIIIAINVILLNKNDVLRKRNEDKFKSLLESAPEAIIIVNNDGQIVLVNRQAENLFEYSRQELIGREVEMLMPERFSSPHRNHRINYFLKPDARNMGKGLELFGRKKNGKEFNLEISLSPLETEEGILISAAIRDITERKKTEEKIKQSEEIFRTLVTGVKDYAIMMLDVNGNILTWNEGAELIKGYSETEVKGKNISMFYIKEETGKGIPALILNMASEQGSCETEGWRVKKDGTLFWADVVVTALYDTNNQLSGFAKVTRDITERKKTEEILADFNRQLSNQVQTKTTELQETAEQLRLLSTHLQNAREEERSTIAREIHDELGQMLTGIRMDMVWLRKNIPEKTNPVTDRFESMLELLNETRDTMRRIARGLHPDILNNLGLVSALKSYAQEFETRSGIKTNFTSLLEGINDLQLDAAIAINLYRIFQESLTNAAKHASAGAIEAVLTQDENNLLLHIQDDGKGFIMNEAAKKKTLGLVSMRERMLAIDGTCQITSVPLEGTTIVLTVPIKFKS
ncbi:MAG: PAS domain S-box protein [Bacteroidetes bacterium]|nr:PAS domain S-box protein [Bacteroidota bacterium]